jgi:hypothetical protein
MKEYRNYIFICSKSLFSKIKNKDPAAIEPMVSATRSPIVSIAKLFVPLKIIFACTNNSKISQKTPIKRPDKTAVIKIVLIGEKYPGMILSSLNLGAPENRRKKTQRPKSPAQRPPKKCTTLSKPWTLQYIWRYIAV